MPVLPALALTAPAMPVEPTVRPARPAPSMPATLRPVFYQALTKDAGAAYNLNAKGCATLPGQKLTGCFDNGGARFSGTGSLALHLAAYGRGATLAAVKAVRPVVEANQVSYGHGNLSEWWRVLPLGFEQGFTITKRPAGQGELVLALAANHNVSRRNAGAPTIRHSRAEPAAAKAGGGNPPGTSPSIPLRSEGGNGIVSHGPAMTKKGNELGWGRLRYGKLVVTDARGKVVPATMKSKGSRILIAVNDTHATYPLTVDPLVWLEQRVSASDDAEFNEFGVSVALDGTTALVGARQCYNLPCNGPGAAYVFTESDGTWNQTAKLTASDGAVGDAFGESVALDGTTALVGASQCFYNCSGPGAAYVFTESGGTWSQTAKLTAGDGATGDAFGESVALDGTTALVGAMWAGGPGAAYVFTESDGTWNQTAKLTAGDGAANDEFGISVALGGTTVLAGAPQHNASQGAAYVFSESGGTWSQTAELTANDGVEFDRFGHSVALDGTTALVGAMWAGGPGAAYVFTESGGTWSQTVKLTASDGAANDEFGISVALDGTTALVGAPQHNVSQGTAYVFSESGGTWSQTVELTASDERDGFGSSLALDGTTMTVLVGSPSGYGISGGVAYFEGKGNLGLNVSAPETVGQGQTYVSQTIATNNDAESSPAVSATMAIPAAAGFVSVTPSQGSCSEASGVVTCNFGPIPGGGTATANVILQATGAPGTTIRNTASVAQVTPPLMASAPTQITAATACPQGYTQYDGTLAAGHGAFSPSYRAPAGEENAILIAPAGLHLYLLLDHVGRRDVYRVPGNEVHRRGPAGRYSWAVWAQGGGNYTLCILHP